MNIYTAFAVHISIIPSIYCALNRVLLLPFLCGVQPLRPYCSISAVRLFNLGGQGVQFFAEYSKVAIDVISDFLLENDMTVYIVIFDKTAYQISEKLFIDIAEYIDDNYVDEHTDYRRESMRLNMPMRSIMAEDMCECKALLAEDDLDSKLKQIDESFSQMLLRKIDEKGMTDAECYKKANIERKLFSKIRSDVHYKPSKPTAIAFAISLELSLEETEDMLKKAGFALSHSNKFDIIIEYFISKGNYNIFERLTTINLILHALNINIGNKLTYKARKKSNDTILSIPNFDVDEKDIGIVNGFKYAKTAIEEIVTDEKALESFKNFFQEKVHIIHYQVPKDIDLNHYFEIMNSRGEQLEKHEIIKARLMSVLKKPEEKSKFNAIWENCSDMAIYIQCKYKEKLIFGDDLCDLIIKDFSDIPTVNRHHEDYVSLRELITTKSGYEDVKPDFSDDKPDTFQPIIDFPNFLHFCYYFN